MRPVFRHVINFNHIKYKNYLCNRQLQVKQAESNQYDKPTNTKQTNQPDQPESRSFFTDDKNTKANSNNNKSEPEPLHSRVDRHQSPHQPPPHSLSIQKPSAEAPAAKQRARVRISSVVENIETRECFKLAPGATSEFADEVRERERPYELTRPLSRQKLRNRSDSDEERVDNKPYELTRPLQRQKEVDVEGRDG